MIRMGGIFRLIFFIFLGYLILKILKFIFLIGKTTGEFKKKADEMNGKDRTSGHGKKENVIELDKNQYKVE
jgi:hypothetical protein